MNEEIDVVIREAVPDDAAGILNHLTKTTAETGFITMDEDSLEISVAEEKEQLAKLYASQNSVLFVALADDEVIATASIHGERGPKTQHIGELGIVIAQQYWGLGLGTAMMEELIYWANESGSIKRLELTVQARNTRARHLYEKMGFVLEAVMPRGVKDHGEYLDVCLMSMLIGEIE